MKRQEMIDFLKNHFRYSTMNSWNGETSYAANVKIRQFVPRELLDNGYSLLEVEDTQFQIGDILRSFDIEHGHKWQAGFNGRSSGYIVLYQGGKEPSGYKSRCTSCRQLNYRTVEESGKQCGVCHKQERENITPEHMRVFSTGKGTDHGEDFAEWDIQSIRDRVKLVKEFDDMVEDCKASFIEMCKNYTVEEEIIMVPKKIKVLKERP